MFLKLLFASLFSDLFIAIQYAVLPKSLSTTYVSLYIYMCAYVYNLNITCWRLQILKQIQLIFFTVFINNKKIPVFICFAMAECTRDEINFNRLLQRCEDIAGHNDKKNWRLEKVYRPFLYIYY